MLPYFEPWGSNLGLWPLTSRPNGASVRRACSRRYFLVDQCSSMPNDGGLVGQWLCRGWCHLAFPVLNSFAARQSVTLGCF